MQIVNVLGSKGGVGTSTMAAMIAAALIADGSRVVVVDATATGDITAIDASGLLHVCVDMPTNDETEQIDFLIVDHPTHKPESSTVSNPVSDHCVETGINLLVTTNRYLPLLRAIAVRHAIHGLVVVRHHDSHLNINDVLTVVAITPERTLVVPFDPAIANLNDAGRLLSHTPRHLQRLPITQFVVTVIESVRERLAV